MTAVLDAGRGAVLSHQSAARHLGFRIDSRGPIHVTVPRRLPQRKGVQRHYSVLQPDEVTRSWNIPITTMPRLMLDLAAVLDEDALQRASSSTATSSTAARPT
jgi:hypothetical protein